jgi:hypothetical protein
MGKMVVVPKNEIKLQAGRYRQCDDKAKIVEAKASVPGYHNMVPVIFGTTYHERSRDDGGRLLQRSHSKQKIVALGLATTRAAFGPTLFWYVRHSLYRISDSVVRDTTVGMITTLCTHTCWLNF